LLSGSSDGMLILWKLDKLNHIDQLEVEEAARNNTQARITSASMIGLHESEKRKKRKKKNKQNEKKEASDSEEDDKEEEQNETKKAKKIPLKRK